MHVSWSIYVRSGVSPIWKPYPWALTFVDGEFPLLMSPWVSDYTQPFVSINWQWQHPNWLPLMGSMKNEVTYETWKTFKSLVKFSHPWSTHPPQNFISERPSFPTIQDWVRPRWITVAQALHAVSLQLVERSTEDRGCSLCSCLLESTPCVVCFLTFWNSPVWSALQLIPLFWLKQEDTVETILWRNFGMLFSPLLGRLPKVERFGLPPQHLPK